MASIDSYRHRRLGWLRCPIRKPPRSYPPVDELAIYVIEEDTDPTDRLQARAGDLLIGGGSGEWDYFRLSPRGALWVLSNASPVDGARNEMYEARWSWSVAYAICSGLEELGWRVGDDVETWLAERLGSFVISCYPELIDRGSDELTPVEWTSLIRKE